MMQNLGINYIVRVTTDGRLPEIVLDDIVAAVNDVLHEALRSTDISYDTEVTPTTMIHTHCTEVRQA